MSEKYESQDKAFDEKLGILTNKIGLLSQKELNRAESKALIKAYDTGFKFYSETDIFSEKDVCELHKLFLGEIYEWAGIYRIVDISSEEIRWCHALHIPAQMKEFSNLLSGLTPFHPNLSKKEIATRLAKIHGELIIIHPFRDGNGRTTRLLCDILLMQANHKPIEREIFFNKDFIQEYHESIKQIWRDVNYSKMIELFILLLASE